MEKLLQRLYNKQLEIQGAVIEERKTGYDIEKQFIKELFVELENIIEEIGKYREATEADKFKIGPRSAMDSVEILPFNTYYEAMKECSESGRSDNCIKVI